MASSAYCESVAVGKDRAHPYLNERLQTSGVDDGAVVQAVGVVIRDGCSKIDCVIMIVERAVSGPFFLYRAEVVVAIC